VKEITTINSQLDRLAINLRTSPSKPSGRRQAAKYFDPIRSQAIELYQIFQARFFEKRSCICPAPHTAGLRLEIVPVTRGSKLQRSKVLFSFDISKITQSSIPWNWREIEFEPVQRPLENGVDADCNDNSFAVSYTVTTTAKHTFSNREKPVHEQKSSFRHQVKGLFNSVLSSGAKSSKNEGYVKPSTTNCTPT